MHVLVHAAFDREAINMGKEARSPNENGGHRSGPESAPRLPLGRLDNGHLNGLNP